MGLDIYAYRQIKEVPESAVLDERGGFRSGIIAPMINPCFPGRADDVNSDGFFSVAEGEHVLAMGYSSYGAWRDWLAKIAGWPPTSYDDAILGEKQSHAAGAWAATEGAFWELINFSDCEGTLGAATSRKLADDFARFQPQADAHENERFREIYADMRKAFEMASDGGCVVFR